MSSGRPTSVNDWYVNHGTDAIKFIAAAHNFTHSFSADFRLTTMTAKHLTTQLSIEINNTIVCVGYWLFK